MLAGTVALLAPLALRPDEASPYPDEMDVKELLGQVTDNLTVGRVFGEPIQHGDVLIVPVAKVRGGAGGGGGTDPGKRESGSGGGGGFEAKPAGVYVVTEGTASWRPAVDVTRIVVGGQVVAMVIALVVRSIVKRALKARS